MSLSISSPIYIPMTQTSKKNYNESNINIYKSGSLPEHPNTPDDNFWKNFGRDLANLHLCQKEQFGLDYDNYIGYIKKNKFEEDELESMEKITKAIGEITKLIQERKTQFRLR